jgi:hypothetical protein
MFPESTKEFTGKHENLHDVIFTVRDLLEHTDLYRVECGSFEKTAEFT